MEEKNSMAPKKSFLDSLSPSQIFTFGIVEGILVLCTIGFFIMLGMYFNDGGSSGSKSYNTAAGVVADPEGTESPRLVDLAEQIGLNMDDFVSCVESKQFAAQVQEDEREAQAVGGRGTPYSILIGPKGETYPINGAQPFEVIDALIKKLTGGTVDPALEQYIPAVQTGLTLRAADPKTEAVRGNPNAKITIVEYSDFECPYCKRFHQTMQQVMATHGDNIKWVYRHFPLDSLHRNARTEALAAECAYAEDEDKFWELTDLIFAVTPSNDGIDVTL